jgi:4-hydroxy-2-oxoheptanedioate aldolase
VRENRVRSIWRDGGVVLNGWLHVPSSYAAEVMAHAGWDSLTIDLQHGPPDAGSVIPMLQAISTTDVVPFARVNWNDPGTIMKLLDAGCYGIICPMIEGREDAESFVSACRYPPEGYRSYGPFRASLYGGPDYAANANETVVTVAMIETAQALDDLDGILGVPGLDAVFVGPSDLGQALGHGPGMDREEPEMIEAIGRVVGSAREKGLAAGIFTGSTEYAARTIDEGFNFVNVSTDVRFMADGASAAVSALRDSRSPL